MASNAGTSLEPVDAAQIDEHAPRDLLGEPLAGHAVGQPRSQQEEWVEHGIGTERHEIGTSPALGAAMGEPDANDTIVRDLEMRHRGASHKPDAWFRLIQVHQAVENRELRVDGTSRTDARRAATR